MVETRKNSPTKRVFLDNSYKRKELSYNFYSHLYVVSPKIFNYSYQTKGEQLLRLPSRHEFARFLGALETDKDTWTIFYR